MNIDKKGFRYRLSNVVAWGGSLGGVFLIVMLVVIAARSADGYKTYDLEEPAVMGLAVYLGCALINYLMVGSPRLLPWRDIEDQE